jgi:hypothetical protein
VRRERDENWVSVTSEFDNESHGRGSEVRPGGSVTARRTPAPHVDLQGCRQRVRNAGYEFPDAVLPVQKYRPRCGLVSQSADEEQNGEGRRWA